MESKHSLRVEDYLLEDDMEELEDRIQNADSKGKMKRALQPPCCQVDKCEVDLSEAKRYHRRHKVCEAHSKAPAALVSGLLQRFCQQCSRFQELTEFDDAKRSCRRRLAGHNERRRKSSGEGSNRKVSMKEKSDEKGHKATRK